MKVYIFSLSPLHTNLYPCYPGEREGVPALREVRVPAEEVVHAGHCLYLQQMDQVRDKGLRERAAREQHRDGLAGGGPGALRQVLHWRQRGA